MAHCARWCKEGLEVRGNVIKCLKMHLCCGWQEVKCPSGCCFGDQSVTDGTTSNFGHWGLCSLFPVAKIGFIYIIPAVVESWSIRQHGKWRSFWNSVVHIAVLSFYKPGLAAEHSKTYSGLANSALWSVKSGNFPTPCGESFCYQATSTNLATSPGVNKYLSVSVSDVKAHNWSEVHVVSEPHVLPPALLRPQVIKGSQSLQSQVGVKVESRSRRWEKNLGRWHPGSI